MTILNQAVKCGGWLWIKWLSTGITKVVVREQAGSISTRVIGQLPATAVTLTTQGFCNVALPTEKSASKVDQRFSTAVKENHHQIVCPKGDTKAARKSNIRYFYYRRELQILNRYLTRKMINKTSSVKKGLLSAC